MATPLLNRRALVRDCYDAAVAAVEPGAAVARALDAAPWSGPAPHVIALGKAAVPMARAALSALAARGQVPAGGVVVAPDGPAAPELARSLPLARGDHPVPGARSLAAADAIARAAAAIQETDSCWVLLSGGASSLAAAPAEGVSADSLAGLFRRLLASGMSVGAMNAERRRVLRWGGGRLARAIRARQIRVLAVSDVPGDVESDIGSGPCSPDPSGRVAFEVVARNADAVAGAARFARAAGWTVVEGAPLAGEASRAGEALGRELLRLAIGSMPACVVRGGETTVTLGDSPGTGGRSQELALAAAGVLAGSTGVTLLAAGTDGRDGPTDAAGAIVDGATWRQALESGADPAAALARHDAYGALDAAGALLRSGPTGTNVMDIAIGLAGR